MHGSLMVFCTCVCLTFASSALAQYACTPGEIPDLADPVELEILEIQSLPGTAMVPGMQVISAGGQVALLSEPSIESEQCGELDAGVSRCLLGVTMDEFGEIWYMLRENEEIYHRAWCRGNMLTPDLNHITGVPFLVWLASGFASTGQMSMAHRLIENINGIGIISEEDDDVLILVYNPAYPVTTEWEEMFSSQDCTCLYAGQLGFSYNIIENMASMYQISPSGRYFAIGADGTGTWRGSVDLVDLETCVKYRYSISHSGVGFCSDWIQGDFLLMESIGQRPEALENWSGIENQPWINYSYRTDAEGSARDIVLMHGNRAWMILPEDRYYNYRMNNSYGLYENGIFFDVTASPNVIPSLAGIESDHDFSEWIDSMGGQNEAFPRFDFRVYVDTLNMSVSCLNLSAVSSETEE